jgi:hypothetical protein
MMGKAQMAAPDSATAPTTASMSPRVISGRTASWTMMMSAWRGTACSASHTESWRMPPP